MENKKNTISDTCNHCSKNNHCIQLLTSGIDRFLSNRKHTLVRHLHHALRIIDVGTGNKSVLLLLRIKTEKRIQKQVQYTSPWTSLARKNFALEISHVKIRHCQCAKYDTVNVQNTTLSMYKIRHCQCTKYDTVNVQNTTLSMYKIRHCQCTKYNNVNVQNTTMSMYKIRHCQCTKIVKL